MLQRYVSKELTHFVGRSLSSDDERYERLLEILDNGLLRGTGISDEDIKKDKCDVTYEGNVDKNKALFSNNTLVKEKSVCFCDIPVSDLGIHMSKYSKFGLSFLKEFLIEKRANPVLYISIDSEPSYQDTTIGNKREIFDKFFNALNNPILSSITISRLNDLAKLNNLDGLKDIANKICEFKRFFTIEILPFLKSFECCKSEFDIENFYMEREWRVPCFLKFKLDDVCRIILPKSYIKRFKEDIKCFGENARCFKEDIPDYYGQITFADDYILPE